MGWFCLLWTFFIAQVSCQELNINSCTRDEVNFICVIRGSPNLTSLILAWSSPEYIGQGDALRFTTATMPGMNSTSVINENVTATLTSNTEIDGVPKLVSMLRIIGASQSSLITCSSVTNESSANIMFDSSAFRGRPQNVGAREYSAGSCDILVSWEPPANIDRSDISHYIIYVPSQNMMNISSSTTKFLTIPNCRDGNNSIQVAAVNRLGCVGRNSSLIKLNLVETPTTQATRPHSATAIAALVVGVLSLLMVMVLVVVVAILIRPICVLYRKAKNCKFTRDEDKKSSHHPPSIEISLQQQSPRSSMATPRTTQHQLTSSTAGQQTKLDQCRAPPGAPLATHTLMFSSSMSDEEFFKWLRSKGVSNKDGNALFDNGITPSGFLQCDMKDFDDIELTKLGKKLFLKIFTEVKGQHSDRQPSERDCSHGGSRDHAPQHSGQMDDSNEDSTSATRLNDGDHGSIYEKLVPHAAKWRDIGKELGFKEQEMENIQSNPMLMMQALPQSYLRAMLSQWLQWAPGDGRGSTGFATRESLRAALLRANLGQLAQQFK